MEKLFEHWKSFLLEAGQAEVAFSGILKLKPSSATLSGLQQHLVTLPEDAIQLPEERLHVTLIHQSVLKPFREQIKAAGDNPPWIQVPVPEVKLSSEVRSATDGEKASWAIMIENQQDFKNYVLEVMKSLGAEPTDPEPDRHFHITLANKTGKPGDSVSLVEKEKTGAKNGRDWQKKSDRITDHPRLKKQVLDMGPNKNTGGGKGHKKSSYKRGKSAPPVAEIVAGWKKYLTEEQLEEDGSGGEAG